MKILTAILVLALGSCGNYSAPHVSNNVSHVASFDGREQNSGIISLWPTGARGDEVMGFHVTAGFRARQVAMIEQYGSRFTPPLTTDDGWTPFPDGTGLINPQAMSHFLDMNQWRRNGQSPAGK